MGMMHSSSKDSLISQVWLQNCYSGAVLGSFYWFQLVDLSFLVLQQCQKDQTPFWLSEIQITIQLHSALT